MKKLLSLLLVAVMLFASLAMTSCDPNNGQNGQNNQNNGSVVDLTNPTVGYNGEEVTIKFYHTMGTNLRPILDRYIVEFNALYPNIHIVSEAVGAYEDVRDQIKTEITVGGQPNIAYCYPDHVALYNIAGAVQTLDGLIDSKIEVTRADGSKEILGLTDAQKADFIQGYYDEGKSFGDNLMYTLPLSKSTEVLYYNKTFFDAHGLTPPKTWAELKSLCQTIKSIDPSSIPLGYDSESNWFITMCEQYGYPYTSADENNHYLFDNAQNKAFVKEFKDWYDAGYITTKTLYGSYTSGLFTSTGEIKSYMSIGSSAGATKQRPAKDTTGAYPFEVGIASIPQANAEQGKVISQGPSLCIFKKSNPQEVIASWLFVKFLTTSIEFQAEFSMESGYVPVIKSVGQNEQYAAFLSKANGGDYIAALAAQLCLDQEKYYFTSPAFNGSSVARDEVGNLMCKVFGLPKEGIDEAIDKAFRDAVSECEYSG